MDKIISKYMKLAENIGLKSLSNELKVGSVLIDKNCKIIKGNNFCPEPFKQNGEHDSPEWIHAEESVLTSAMKRGISTFHGTLIITHAPCLKCSKLIMLSGINKLYYKHDYKKNDGLTFLSHFDIIIKQYKEN
jgi:dCMP deaminase